MAPRYESIVQEAASSTAADAITYNLLHAPTPPISWSPSINPPPTLPLPEPLHTHTHPCWYLDVLSIRTWKWGRVQIQALSRKVSCSRGSCLPGWIDVASRLLRWWRGLKPCKTQSALRPLPSASAAVSTPRAATAMAAATWNPEIRSAHLGLSCCSDGRMVKSYQRLSPKHIWAATWAPPYFWKLGWE